jgi:hypothetical protein
VNGLITLVLGLALGGSIVALLRLARTAGARHAPHPAVRPGAFEAAPDGTRWITCHDMACGHMTTRWVPQPGGGHRCEHSARHRGAVHLTGQYGGDQ